MNKNSKLHFAIETEIFEAVKKEAIEKGLSISALCRFKLREYPKLEKIDLMLETLCKKLDTQLNINRR